MGWLHRAWADCLNDLCFISSKGSPTANPSAPPIHLSFATRPSLLLPEHCTKLSLYKHRSHTGQSTQKQKFHHHLHNFYVCWKPQEVFRRCLGGENHKRCFLYNESRDSWLQMAYQTLCIWCNAMCLRGSRFKKHYFPHTVHYCCSSMLRFLKRADFYKAHRSEKRGVLWLASYPVCCVWPNT